MKQSLNKILILLTGFFVFGSMMLSCSDSESYSDLLKEETYAVNWYLSGCRVEAYCPEDGDFEIGPDAPFYKMNDDGTLYMQVLDKGDLEDMAQSGDRVYFRYMMMNLKNYYEAGYEMWSGNAVNIGEGSESTSFIYGNYQYSSTSQYGSGIQVPLQYVGYNSRVKLVVKSAVGLTSLSGQCIPYVMDIRYFKGDY